MTGKELQSLADKLLELARKSADKSNHYSHLYSYTPKDENGDETDKARGYSDMMEEFNELDEELKSAFRSLEYAANYLKKIEAQGESL